MNEFDLFDTGSDDETDETSDASESGSESKPEEKEDNSKAAKQETVDTPKESKAVKTPEIPSEVTPEMINAFNEWRTVLSAVTEDNDKLNAAASLAAMKSVKDTTSLKNDIAEIRQQIFEQTEDGRAYLALKEKVPDITPKAAAQFSKLMKSMHMEKSSRSENDYPAEFTDPKVTKMLKGLGLSMKDIAEDYKAYTDKEKKLQGMEFEDQMKILGRIDI